VRVRLISPQYTFASGRATLWFREPQVAASGKVDDLVVSSDFIENADGLRPGEFTIVVSNVVVVDRGGVVKRVPVFTLTASITRRQVSASVANIQVPPLACCRLQLLHRGDPIGSSRRTIGVVTQQVTLEVPSDDKGGVDLLLEPGAYYVHLLDDVNRRTSFVVGSNVLETSVEFDISEP